MKLKKPVYGNDLKFNSNGLIPAVVQDARSKQVLMLAYMNQKALDLTLSTGFLHFWSRSRNQLWKKGGTSGNFLNLVEIRLDCDADTILAIVNPAGPACHTGQISCFYSILEQQDD